MADHPMLLRVEQGRVGIEPLRLNRDTPRCGNRTHMEHPRDTLVVGQRIPALQVFDEMREMDGCAPGKIVARSRGGERAQQRIGLAVEADCYLMCLALLLR